MTKLHRFFIEENLSEKKILSVKDRAVLNQWARVLRFEAGDKIILFDGSGSDFLFSIEKISNKDVELSFVEERPILFKPKTNLHLIQSVIKRENFELILEKVTELGVQKILPVISDRSVKLKLNLERSKKIIQEAAEQSDKAILPEILDLKKLSDVLNRVEEGRSYIVLDPRGENFSLQNFHDEKVGVFIGPEGGWSEEEINLFKENNVPIFSLGKQILRAETAAISFTSLMQLGR